MPPDIFSAEFARQAWEAGNCAYKEAVALGIEVVYVDEATGLNVVERPDGRRFEIRFVPGRAPNYEVVRELPREQAA